MITTSVCDDGRHTKCPGHGLVRGTLRPPHEPEHPGEQVWVTVECGCPCHARVCPYCHERVEDGLAFVDGETDSLWHAWCWQHDQTVSGLSPSEAARERRMATDA